jgi:hypothetical protein
VILSFFSTFFPWRRVGALVVVAVATTAYGCGSSNDGTRGPATGGRGELAKQLKDEDLYKYEGTGKAKRKVEISRRERVKLLHDAANKSN